MKKAVSDFLARQWLNVLESIDEGILVIDPQNHIEFMNEGAAQLTGQSGALAIGRPASRLFAANPWLLELVQTTRESGLRKIGSEGSLVGRWAREVPVWASAMPLLDDAGDAIGTLLTLQDLTQKRELESRTLAVDRLGHLEVLVAGLAHEIKNPLSGMRGAAQILASAGESDARVRECSRIMVEEIDRLNGLMTQLLDLTGPPRMERSAVNIHQLLDRVLTIEGAGHADCPRFVRDFDPSLPSVTGDASRLTQVFLNLVRNAVEASPPQSAVTLTTRMESYHVGGTHGRGQFLSLDVCDQGDGIPDENIERIFSPFFTTKNGGTGLGLAICQRIVNEHGGLLRVRSALGQGATFTVTLPVDRGGNHRV